MTDSQPDGFLATPTAGNGRGILVLHAWWGLNATMKAFCTRLSAAGFVAFAPDLYHGKVADTIEGRGSAWQRSRCHTRSSGGRNRRGRSLSQWA